MKKSLIFIAVFAVVTTLFAEIETMTCESEEGTCVYELDGTVFHEYCTCDGGTYDKINNNSNSAAMPRELDCSQNIDADVYCKAGNFSCENDAGRCHVDQHGYGCSCWGVWSANGAVEGAYTGTVEFAEESCNSKLVEICGTEPATAREVCEDQEILNQCISYIKTFADGCFEPFTDDDIEEILDQQAHGYNREEWSHQLAYCCQMEQQRKDFQKNLECFENCQDDNCCDTCGINPVYHEDEDAANTEAPTTGTTPEDTAVDTAVPVTDEAPAENKEESKSDGCSMLFI